MKTQTLYTHLTSDGHLFQVVEGVDAAVALDIASDLTDGVAQILERFYDAVNDGDSVYCSELKALRMMSETASALVLSVGRSMEREKNDDK